MKRYNLISVLIVGIILAGLIVFPGCDNKLKGTRNTEVAPSIYWADVTIDTSYSANPNLRWFSTDQDGLVIAYQYSVILASTVDSLGGAQAVADNFPADEQWTVVRKDSATIQLYASQDTSIYVPQYVFLRAMDDDSLFSPIIYKYLRRNNHAPTCYLILPDGAQWCLPETTSAWKGIRVAWVGKDSIDITGLQPDFRWNIRVYGPFTSAPTSGDTTGTFRTWVDVSTGEPWVLLKEIRLTNLVTGYYLMYATCRDDAYVPAIPATGILEVYEPTWIRHAELTKPILVADHSKYVNRTQQNPFPYTSNELYSTYRDSVNAFYLSLLHDMGYTDDQIDFVTYTQSNNVENSVPKSDLYNHRLVIVNDMDIAAPLIDQQGHEQQTPYSEYLAVGGDIWVIGRRSFDHSWAGRQDFPASGENSIAYKYFNLNAIFSPTLTNLHQAEFVGGTSLISGFPDISTDTMKVRQITWALRSGDQDPGPDTLYNYTVYEFDRGLPGVDFIMRRPNSETIYTYDAIYPDTSAFQNFPVAVRYNQGSYKTSYFCFPLYFIHYDQAVTITRNMLDWFFQEN